MCHDEHRPCKITSEVFPPPSIKWHLTFHITPQTFHGVGVSLSVWIHKVHRVANCHMFIATFGQAVVSFPAALYDGTSRLNFVLKDAEKSLAVDLVPGHHHEAAAGFAAHPTQHPLTLDNPAHTLFPLAKFAFVNPDYFSLSTNLPFSPDTPVNQHFTTKAGPVTYTVATESKLLSDECV